MSKSREVILTDKTALTIIRTMTVCPQQNKNRGGRLFCFFNFRASGNSRFHRSEHAVALNRLPWQVCTCPNKSWPVRCWPHACARSSLRVPVTVFLITKIFPPLQCYLLRRCYSHVPSLFTFLSIHYSIMIVIACRSFFAALCGCCIFWLWCFWIGRYVFLTKKSSAEMTSWILYLEALKFSRVENGRPFSREQSPVMLIDYFTWLNGLQNIVRHRVPSLQRKNVQWVLVAVRVRISCRSRSAINTDLGGGTRRTFNPAGGPWLGPIYDNRFRETPRLQAGDCKLPLAPLVMGRLSVSGPRMQTRPWAFFSTFNDCKIIFTIYFGTNAIFFR